MKKIRSKCYPDIVYEPSNDIWFDANEVGLPFCFSVREELTKSEEKMNLIGEFLDDIEHMKIQAYETLTQILADKHDKYHETVTYFLEFHRNEFDEEQLSELLGVSETKHLTLEDMIMCLKLNGLSCNYDAGWKEQHFVMDFSFHPALTDELLVVHFNSKKEIIIISHES